MRRNPLMALEDRDAFYVGILAESFGMAIRVRSSSENEVDPAPSDTRTRYSSIGCLKARFPKQLVPS